MDRDEDHGLNDRQLRFAQGLLAGKPAERAYVDAGYAKTHAASHASHLARNRKVERYLRRERRKTAERVELEVDDIVRGLYQEATHPRPAAASAARIRAWELLGQHLGMWPKDGARIDVWADVAAVQARLAEHDG